jgi:hypothetical protein
MEAPSTNRKANMQVIFVHGGYINDMGPFEPGALVSVPDEIGNHLLGTGAVTPVLPASKKPISFSLNVKFDNKESTDV